jgi:hypothetical protein
MGKKPKQTSVGAPTKDVKQDIKKVHSTEIEELFKPLAVIKSKKKNDILKQGSLNAKKKKERKETLISSSYSEASTMYGLLDQQYPIIVNPEAPLERIDAESGLPVYKAHLLKVGEGGGTALCPFDCNCCF